MYWDEQNCGASGNIPEFGAIFMSNAETKRECFNRQIFALPSSKAEFVKHIKAGMVLFLFEFKSRQLFGVYKATSDGAMGIVPHAFSYHGKRFPAQVCFSHIWHCDPLSEKEFRDAIKENYFSSKKFNFGLSEDQVRKLLYLFSSRKLKNKIPLRPLSETVVGAAGGQTRQIGDDRFELSERGYMEPAENDEFNPAAFFDCQASTCTGAKEGEALAGDGVNTEGKLHLYTEEDFLARLGNDDKLLTDDLAENRIYRHGTIQTFRFDSSKYSLDEVRRLADGHRLLPFERVNENQADKIVSCSEFLMDPLDVIANNDYRPVQRVRFFDEYNLQNRSGQAFASDCYGESLDKIKHAIDDDNFILDDSMQRDCNPHDGFKPVDHGHSNLSLFREARELIDDQESLMNRKLESRYRLDCDGSPIRAFEHSASPLHKIRKITAGRLPINDSEPEFGTSSVEGFSSEKNPCPLLSGQRLIYDSYYPVLEGRLNEDMVGKPFCSPSLAKSSGYRTGADKKVVDDGRFRKSERANDEEDSRMRPNPVISMEHHSFFQRKQNLFSFSDKLLTQDRLPQSTVSHNCDPSRSIFDDATITRAVPCSPEHPSLSHGYSASIPANQNSSLVRRNHPDQGSLGDFYSLSKTPQYFSESGKSSRPLDTAPGFGNKGFPASTSRNLNSMLHESTSSFENSDLPLHMYLNTSVPLNYRGSLFSRHSPRNTELENIEAKSREKPVHMVLNPPTPINNRGSLFSKFSPQHTDLKNIEGEQGSFAYPSISIDSPLAFDRNLPIASLDMNKHVPRHEIDMFGSQDYSCSGSKDSCVGFSHPERDLASHENQYFRSSSMKCHRVSEAPCANTVNRRSVFTRLTTSKEESKFGNVRNDTDFNHDGGYMDATADEVMEKLQQGGNLSQIKLRKFGGGRPTHGENAVNEKKAQSHIETNHSIMEKNKLNDSSLDDTDGIDEVPKETRVVDFKSRSERKKIVVGITAESDRHSTLICANEAKCSVKKTLKRKKLVRPIFSKTGPVADAMTSQNPLPIIDKDDKHSCETAISVYEAVVFNDNTRSSTCQPVECKSSEHQNPQEQKGIVACVLPSTSVVLKGHETTNVDLQISIAQVPKETTRQKGSGTQTCVEGILANDAGTTISDLNLPKSSLEGFRPGAGCGNNLVKAKHKKTKKRKKKTARTRKMEMGSSQ